MRQQASAKSTSCPMNYEVFPHRLEGTGTFSIAVWALEIVRFAAFRWLFSCFSEFPHTHVLISPKPTVTEITLETPKLSLPSCALFHTPAALASVDAPLCLLSSRRQLGLAWVPLPRSLENLQACCRSKRKLTWLFSDFGDPCPTMPDGQCSKHHCFIYPAQFFAC